MLMFIKTTNRQQGSGFVMLESEDIMGKMCKKSPSMKLTKSWNIKKLSQRR